MDTIVEYSILLLLATMFVTPVIMNLYRMIFPDHEEEDEEERPTAGA